MENKINLGEQQHETKESWYKRETKENLEDKDKQFCRKCIPEDVLESFKKQ